MVRKNISDNIRNMNISFKILLITLSSGIIAFGSFAIINSETINVNKTNDIFHTEKDKKCTFCHSDKIKYEYVHAAAEDDCENCHQPTGKKHPKSNVKGFILVSQMPDLCYNCHESKSDKKYVHTPIKTKGCLICHSPHGSSNKSLLIKNPDNDFCQNCNNLLTWRDHRTEKLNTERKCLCDGYHFPHRKGSKWCIENRANLTDTDYEERYG